MNTLTPTQLANFAYWLTEKTDNRGIDKHQGKMRIAYIEYVLLPEFLSKYPTGLLTGFVR